MQKRNNKTYVKNPKKCLTIKDIKIENTPEIATAGNYSSFTDPDNITVYRSNEIFNRNYVELTINIPSQYKAFPVELLLEQKNKLIELLINDIQSNDAHIIQFGFLIQMVIRIFKQHENPADNSFEYLYINSHRYIITFDELPDIFDLIAQYISDRIFDLLFKTANSGWQVDEITVLKLKYHRAYTRNRIGVFSVDYPCARGKNLVFNPIGINEKDNLCVLRCLAAYVKKKTYGNQISRHDWKQIHRHLKNPSNICKYIKYGNIKDVNFDDIPQLERYNKMKINVYKLYKEKASDRFNLQMVKRGNKKYNGNECNLILFEFKNGYNARTWHCCLVKKSIENFIQNFCKIYLPSREYKICNFCFGVLQGAEELKTHKNNYCLNRNLNSRIVYPNPDEFLRFRNFGKCSKNPILGFFDCECALLVQENGDKIHKPIIYSQVIVDTDKMEILDCNTYQGEDCVDHYLDRIKLFWNQNSCREKAMKYEIDYTQEQLVDFQISSHCQICRRKFDCETGKCMHHNHLVKESNYLGALCNRCNLQNTVQSKLIVLAHNASYDISNILKYSSNRHKFKVLTQKSNMKYYQLCVNKNIEMIDSYQFLKSSLDKLIKQFLESNRLNIFHQVICPMFNINEDSVLYKNLALGKMYMCYDFIDNMEKLDSTDFPSSDKFYNQLRET